MLIGYKPPTVFVVFGVKPNLSPILQSRHLHTITIVLTVFFTVLTSIRITFLAPCECPLLSYRTWVLRGKRVLSKARHLCPCRYIGQNPGDLLCFPVPQPHIQSSWILQTVLLSVPFIPIVESRPCSCLLTWPPACPTTALSFTKHQRDLSKLRSDHITPLLRASHGCLRCMRGDGIWRPDGPGPPAPASRCTLQLL